MKKLLIGIAVAGMVAFGVSELTDTDTMEDVAQAKDVAVEEVAVNDTVNDTVYTYVITEVIGDEVNGIALDHVSDYNGGIVLSKEIDHVQVVTGDIIQVTYNDDMLDEIKDLEVISTSVRLAEDGTYLRLAEDGTYVKY